MNIYVASSWRNLQQQGVVLALRTHGYEVYDFKNPCEGDNGFHWSEVDGVYETWTPSQYVAALKHPLSESGFKSDFDAMKWADCGVLVLPCGRSAHLEAGYFVGASKPLHILLADPRHEKLVPELMYKMSTSISEDINELLTHLLNAEAKK